MSLNPDCRALQCGSEIFKLVPTLRHQASKQQQQQIRPDKACLPDMERVTATVTVMVTVTVTVTVTVRPRLSGFWAVGQLLGGEQRDSAERSLCVHCRSLLANLGIAALKVIRLFRS